MTRTYHRVTGEDLMGGEGAPPTEDVEGLARFAEGQEAVVCKLFGKGTNL